MTTVIHNLVGCVMGLFLSLFSTACAYGASPSILIVSENESKIHSQVIAELQYLGLHPQESGTEYITTETATRNLLKQKKPSLIVTLGYQAALLANRSDSTTLNALLSKQSIQDERLCITVKCPDNNRKHVSIYLDQPIARQLNLLTTVLPQAKSIGVLTADFSIHKLDELQQEARKRHLKIKNRTVHAASELNNQFKELIKESDVLLALPDPKIHNLETVPYLLLTSYRYNIPVIGFSKAYVNAGAIAAVFSTPEQIARHILELAQRILSNDKTLKKNLFPPKYFSVSTNRNVARSLEFHLADNKEIKLKLLLLEK